MPRANRHFVPGLVWHLTHRCHKKEFLLKFARDRRRWRRWLFEARKRYRLCVLNYVATSNHIHLLVRDQGREEIPRSMQLIAARTAQEFNRRKRRHGAFWEDRYHATAVETGEHLARCLVYIDLNMVRAGVVEHPSKWEVGGYREIQQPPVRYRVIDRPELANVLAVSGLAELQARHRAWVEEALRTGEASRHDDSWTESVAVGSEGFVQRVCAGLGVRARGRRVDRRDGVSRLREACEAYRGDSWQKNAPLRINQWYWDGNFF